MTCTCPVTGLPVYAEPGLTHVQLGDDYRLSVSVVGDRIVHVRPTGVVTLSAIEQATTLIRQLVEERIPAGLDYVQLDDFTGLSRSTLAARKYYMDEIRARERLTGVVFCGASPLLALSIKLGRRINAMGDNVELVESYPQAIRAALAMLSDTPTPAVPNADDRSPPVGRPWRNVARSVVRRASTLGSQLGRKASNLSRSLLTTSREGPPASPPDDRGHTSWGQDTPVRCTPRAVVQRPDLDLDLDGLFIRYEVIDGDVLHAYTKGYLKQSHVEPIVNRNREAIDAVGCEGLPYFLLDDTDVSGVDFRARRDYSRRMIQLHREHPFKMAVLYSPDRLMRALITLGRTMAPFRVEAATDLGSALRLVEQDRRRGDAAVSGAVAAAGGSSSVYLADLLRFMSSIDWEREGLGADVPQVPDDHPLQHAFEAIEVLKMDVDQLLRQRQLGAEALQQSETLLRTVIDAANEAIISVDQQGRVDLFSASAVALFGRPAVEARGTSFESYLAAPCRDRWNDLLAHHFNGSKSGGELVEVDALRADGGSFPLELSLSLATYNGRRYTIAVGRDLTELKRAAEDKERMERQLHHGQRIRSLGTLAGGIAHDFNNLLMAIQGNISLLRVGTDRDSEDYEALKTIEGQIRSGSNLTSQLLACARKGKYEVRVLDLNKVVTLIAETFWRTHKGIRVHMDLQQDLPGVEADQSQIELVILNLGLNASDAMPQGGDLHFTTRTASPHELPDEVKDAGVQPYLLLEVRDSGQGMTHETLEQIFEPFFTTKDMGHGTGLGLASVYGSVKGHGGQITVHSELGRGTTFTIYLPASEERVEEQRSGEAQVVRRGGTLLMVDDELLVLNVCARLLRKQGYTVLTAEGGNEAIKVYEANQDQIDLVILDLIMPDLGGGETFDRLRSIDAGVKVLLSSGYSQEGEAQLILDRGCDGFIQKPFDMDQIIAQIGDILRSESSTSG